MPRHAVLALTLALAACAAMSARAPYAQAHARAFDPAAAYPEGPLWREGALYVAEMGADRVSAYDAHGAKRTFFHREGCGPTALAPYGPGFLILCHIEGVIVAVDAEGRERFTRDADAQGRLFRDPNDCFADGHGGVYFSDPGLFSRMTAPQGALMHIDAQGLVTRADDGLWYPNGIYVSADGGALYLSETFRRRVLRYEMKPDGTLGARSVFVEIDAAPPPARRFHPPYREAGPDGLEAAADGSLYVAIYGEGRIIRFSPEGAYLGEIDEPARYLTNIAFDPDGNAYTTGAFENDAPPYPGEVRRHAAGTYPAPGPGRRAR